MDFHDLKLLPLLFFHVGLFGKSYTENTGRAMTIIDQRMTIIDFSHEAQRTGAMESGGMPVILHPDSWQRGDVGRRARCSGKTLAP
jgi:hypothetical protein